MTVLVVLRGLTGSGKTETLKQLCRDDRLNLVPVEIDEIKRDRYGTTTRCVPHEDFPEAGRRARELMEREHNVVAEEAFACRQHIDLFLESAGVRLGDPRLLVFRLKCSEKTAQQRKLGALSRADVAGQYRRPVDDLPGEYVIDADARSPTEVVGEIAHILMSLPHDA